MITQGVKRFLCLLVAIQFGLFQFVSTVWGAKVELFDPHKVSVAVVSFPSSTKDRPLVEETTEAIRAKLKAISYFHVVSAETVKSIVNYHADYVKKTTSVSDAERYLSLSKTHWFDRQYAEAEATVDTAIKSFRTRKERGGLLVDALLTKAMILQETKRFSDSKAVFQEALAINPSLTMEGMPIAGRTRRVFNETKSEVLQRLSGGLEIKTNPPAATVYINGVKKGVTPLTLTKIPEGSYLMTIEASRYHTIHEPILVTANTTQFINHKLHWTAGGSGTGIRDFGIPVKTDTILQNEIKMATKIGETLKVDKVILVSSERKGNEEMLVVRTIDTALKAALNPIGLPFGELTNNKENALEKIAGDLDRQARLHLLNNPEEHLEPDMGDIRVLRRHKSFFKTPAFYILAGVIVGGGLGTTLGIVLTRDSDDGGASEEGGVDIEFE